MIDLRCGDCLELMKEIPDGSIDLIVTDPPYNVSATNGGGTINKVKKLNKSLKDLVEANITDGYDQNINDNYRAIKKEEQID